MGGKIFNLRSIDYLSKLSLGFLRQLITVLMFLQIPLFSENLLFLSVRQEKHRFLAYSSGLMPRLLSFSVSFKIFSSGVKYRFPF